MNNLISVTQITKDTNGTAAIQSFVFTDRKAALANHHYFMTSSYGAEGLTYICGMVHDAYGNNVLPPEIWEAPAQA